MVFAKYGAALLAAGLFCGSLGCTSQAAKKRASNSTASSRSVAAAEAKGDDGGADDGGADDGGDDKGADDEANGSEGASNKNVVGDEAGGEGAPHGDGAGENAAAPGEAPDQTAESAGAREPETTLILGSTELCAGIPGEGPLSVEEIEAWLEEENNHQVIDLELPQGLSAARAMIQGVQENPFTRAKIELGRQLYFDKRLSADASVSCADCHHPDNSYGRDTQFGVGIGGQTGNRNSPVSFNRLFSGPQFWDGRAASLEAQAVGPIANPIEMGNTHEAAVAAIEAIPGYRLQFERVFEDGVTIDNVGKAIAAFERVLVTGPSAYDLYEPLRTFEVQFAADLEDLEALKEDDPELHEQFIALQEASQKRPMSDSAKRGRELFFSERVGCTACHAGANFTDEKYHNLGVGMDQEQPDLGRYEVTRDDKDRGAFKTPTVRNVALTGPYMHDGSQKTLEEVVEWYSQGGHPNPHLSDKVKKLNLTDQEKADLVEFMQALTGDLPRVQFARLPE